MIASTLDDEKSEDDGGQEMPAESGEWTYADPRRDTWNYNITWTDF